MNMKRGSLAQLNNQCVALAPKEHEAHTAVEATLREIREIFHRSGSLSSQHEVLDEIAKLLFAHVSSIDAGEPGIGRNILQGQSPANALRLFVAKSLKRSLPESMSFELSSSDRRWFTTIFGHFGTAEWAPVSLQPCCLSPKSSNTGSRPTGETHRLARIRAAQTGITVSAMMRDLLTALLQRPVEAEPAETEPQRRARLLDEVLGRFRREGIGVDTSQILTREEMYDRNAAR